MTATIDHADSVRKTISEQFGVSIADVRGDMTIRGDLRADDLDEIEMVMMLEDEFRFEISDDDMEVIANGTVDGVIQYVRKRLA